MRRNNSIYYISLYAIFTAIIAIMSFIPYLGFLTFGPISMTLLHIPVLVFCYLGGTKHGWAYGLIFGIFSFLRILAMPGGALDAYFINPMISVLPRVIFGLLAGIIFDLIKKINNWRVRRPVIAAAALVLTLLHSVMVLGLLGAFNFREVEKVLGTGFWIAFGTTIVTGTLPEMAIAGLAVLPIAYALVPTYNRVFKTNNPQ